MTSGQTKVAVKYLASPDRTVWRGRQAGSVSAREVEEIAARIYTEISSYTMRISLVLTTRANGARCQRAGLAALGLFLSLLAGCGGGSSSNSSNVAVVSVDPSSLSMVAGQVTRMRVRAVTAAKTPDTTTFTFDSATTKIATVSPAGNVCGGVWDSAFI